ncbi:MAG: TlpA family protein disulfide reductase [Micrococcales bacterium]|nr:TlpA family protein disulfide reductase [Micrococcales bacterium]
MPDTDISPRRPDVRVKEVVVIAVTTLVIVAGVFVVNALRDDGARASPSGSAVPGVSQVEVTGSPVGAPPKVGAVAPDFTTFSTQGEVVILSEMRGTPVWLVFGATWCPNCRAEAPEVQAVQERYGDQVRIVGVYVGESLTTVDAYAERVGLTYVQVADRYTDIASAYRVMGLPTHVFVNPDGTVADITVGTVTARGAFDRIETMLDTDR